MSNDIEIPVDSIHHISFNNWSFPVKDELGSISVNKYFATSGDALVKLKVMLNDAEKYLENVKTWVNALEILKESGKFDYLEIEHLNGKMIIRGVRKRS